MHRQDAVSWLRELALGHYRGEQMPALIHGVDQGSATYQQIFDLLDGANIGPNTRDRRSGLGDTTGRSDAKAPIPNLRSCPQPTIIPSTSTRAPLGNSATPIAARAG